MFFPAFGGGGIVLSPPKAGVFRTKQGFPKIAVGEVANEKATAAVAEREI
jgi:hypothetical protein